MHYANRLQPLNLTLHTSFSNHHYWLLESIQGLLQHFPPTLKDRHTPLWGCEFDCIAEQNAPHFRHFAIQISACFYNVKSYSNLSLMMNEQKIATQNFQRNSHPDHYKFIYDYIILFSICMFTLWIHNCLIIHFIFSHSYTICLNL